MATAWAGATIRDHTACRVESRVPLALDIAWDVWSRQTEYAMACARYSSGPSIAAHPDAPC
jgi:hypothetical protein